MTSRERLIAALEHKEPDRVPYDLGTTWSTGICAGAYKKLLSYLGIKKEIIIQDPVQQLVKVDEDVLKYLKVDTRGIFCNPPSGWRLEINKDDNYKYFTDELGIGWKMPKKSGYYYDMHKHPLKGRIDKEMIDKYPWPDYTDSAIIKGLKEKARQFNILQKKAVVVPCVAGGVFELAPWMRSFEDFFVDLAVDPSLACYLMDKLLEVRWPRLEMILKELGNYITVIQDGEDLGTQDRLMISPEMYRKYVKPREKKLISRIRKVAPKPVYIFFHSCGSVSEIIPDLIEIGVNALGPVQVSAADMDTKRLKREFGKDITFWGGGIDTQYTLPRGSVKEVREEVKRRIGDLAPGGGFIFAPVHNVQPDVPIENFMAMIETLQKYGAY